MTVRVCGRDRAAVHPPDQAHPLEGGEVAAHGLGGDSYSSASSRPTAGRARPTSWAIACWRSSAYMPVLLPGSTVTNLCMCCFTPECVDCQGCAGLTTVCP